MFNLKQRSQAVNFQLLSKCFNKNLFAARFLIIVNNESALEIFCNFLMDTLLVESEGRLRAERGLSDKLWGVDSMDSILKKRILNVIKIFRMFVWTRFGNPRQTQRGFGINNFEILGLRVDQRVKNTP